MTIADFAATLGLPCFPVRADKRPACPHGFKDATRDAEAIRKLWLLYPGPLVGVPTGEISGFDALDIDAPRHPEAGTWLAIRGVPHTKIHYTVSGGLHLLFKHSPGLKCSTGGKLRPGVDVRADGGYIVWWPCIGLREFKAEFAPWPPELLRALRPPKVKRFETHAEPDDRDIGRLIQFVARSSIGERNARLYWAACRLAERNGRSENALLILAAVDSGLSRIEAERTVASAYRHRTA